MTPCVLPAGDLGLDIDRPEDLDAFLALKSKTRTHAYLASARASGAPQTARRRSAISPTTGT